MTGDWKGLRPLVLVIVSALVVAWLCFAALIALSVTSADPVPRSALLAWVLLAAGWNRRPPQQRTRGSLVVEAGAAGAIRVHRLRNLGRPPATASLD
jgi:hypothetical protein